MVFKNHDAWRNHPVFKDLWKDPFPGLKKAIVIYAVYLGCEYAYKTLGPKPIKAAHGHAH